MIITIKYNYDNDWHTIISTYKQVDKAAIAIMSDKELRGPAPKKRPMNSS